MWKTDIYHCVNFARQYGLDIKDMLRRIVYQLVNLITSELPKAVRKFDTKVLLHMFIDPQIRIDEARPLIKEITANVVHTCKECRQMTIQVIKSRQTEKLLRITLPHSLLLLLCQLKKTL